MQKKKINIYDAISIADSSTCIKASVCIHLRILLISLFGNCLATRDSFSFLFLVSCFKTRHLTSLSEPLKRDCLDKDLIQVNLAVHTSDP